MVVPPPKKDLPPGTVRSIRKQAGVRCQKMRYPIAIEPGDATHAYGVVVPDLPGCFSAGDTLDEAMVNAESAVLAWMETTLDQGGSIPSASSLDTLLEAHPEFRDWVWALVTIDPVIT